MNRTTDITEEILTTMRKAMKIDVTKAQNVRMMKVIFSVTLTTSAVRFANVTATFAPATST